MQNKPPTLEGREDDDLADVELRPEQVRVCVCVCVCACVGPSGRGVLARTGVCVCVCVCVLYCSLVPRSLFSCYRGTVWGQYMKNMLLDVNVWKNNYYINMYPIVPHVVTINNTMD